MHLKRLILILCVNFTLTLCQGQSIKICDSAISICPAAFDRLISQDVKAQKFQKEIINLSAEVNTLQFKLKQADSLQKTTANILLVTNEEKSLINESLIVKTNQYDDEKKSKKMWKFGCFSAGILGILGTGYFIVH